MTDATHDDLNAKVRALVDDALADLLLLGFDSADNAAALMAIQSIIRIEDRRIQRLVADFANELLAPGGPQIPRTGAPGSAGGHPK